MTFTASKLFSLVLILSHCKLYHCLLFRSGLEKVLQCYENPLGEGSCPFDDITFWLYTRKHPEGVQITENNMESLPVEENGPWKIIFHGFNSNKDLTPGKDLREAYLARAPYNLLLLDYAAPYMFNISYMCYARAATTSLDLVTTCATQFLHQMRQRGALPPLGAWHVIGHSLGAHTAGGVCARLNSLEKEKVLRLTGLDPAGPFFNTIFATPGRIIAPGDAQFVDTYHTNGGDTYLQFGSKKSCGDVDVRFNGGALQPGCNAEISCNHQRAVDYFAESINPKFPDHFRFFGHASNASDPKVNSLLVGEDISFRLRGDIFVTTNAESPFAQGITRN